MLFERMAGPDGLTGHRAVFAERDVLVECLAAAPTSADARAWAKEFMTGWALPARAPSGESGDCWFTTVSLLDAGAAEHLLSPQARPTIDDLARWAAQPRAERFAHLEPEPVEPHLASSTATTAAAG